MKKALPILIGVLAVLIVLSFVKDVLIKVSVEKGVEAVTGLPLKMQSFKVGILRTLVGIKGLKLYNPSGYPDMVMIDMPQVYVDYNLAPIFKGKVHFQDMRIDLKEFTVVKNKDGEINLNSLNVVKEQKEEKAQKKKPGAQKKSGGKAMGIQIDNLELKIGKVVYKDYSQGPDPVVREMVVNLDKRYQDITDPKTLLNLILFSALSGSPIANLADIDINAMKGSISGMLSTTAVQGSAEDAVSKARESWDKTSEEQRAKVREAAKKAEVTAKEAQENLKKTAQELKDKFKFSFGGEQ
ncbi:MAG: hypothetical protein ABH875_06630 [Candidatus Omnitrophota bacterium]